MQLLLGVGGEGSSISLTEYIKSLSGLVAYYPLNETSGDAINQAPDTVGLLNGTVNGPTRGTQGQVGNAYSFDGTNDIVTVADNDLLDITDALSIFAIINPIGYGEGNFGRIVDKGTSYLFTVGNNNAQSTGVTVGSSAYDSPVNTAPFNTNTFVGFTWDRALGSNQGTHYKNGTAVGNFTEVDQNTITTTDFCIGNRAATDRTFNGTIQHLMVFNRVVTSEEALRMASLAGLV